MEKDKKDLEKNLKGSSKCPSHCEGVDHISGTITNKPASHNPDSDCDSKNPNPKSYSTTITDCDEVSRNSKVESWASNILKGSGTDGKDAWEWCPNSCSWTSDLSFSSSGSCGMQSTLSLKCHGKRAGNEFKGHASAKNAWTCKDKS